MSDEKERRINPFNGALSFGPGGALGVTIGASIMRHDIHKLAMTILTGGAIIGAAAGLVGWVIKQFGDDKSFMQKFSQYIVASAAFFTSPFMGEYIMQYNLKWADLIVDQLIGSGIITGGVLAIVGFAYCFIALCGFKESASANRNPTMFNNITVRSDNKAACTV